MSVPACEMCGDTGPLIIGGRCHPLAPTKIEVDGDVMTVRCYLPDCARVIARFKVELLES